MYDVRLTYTVKDPIPVGHPGTDLWELLFHLCDETIGDIFRRNKKPSSPRQTVKWNSIHSNDKFPSHPAKYFVLIGTMTEKLPAFTVLQSSKQFSKWFSVFFHKMSWSASRFEIGSVQWDIHVTIDSGGQICR